MLSKYAAQNGIDQNWLRSAASDGIPSAAFASLE